MARILLTLVVLAVTLSGAGGFPLEEPAPSPGTPLSAQQRKEREGLRLYGEGLVHEKNRLWLQALKSYEKARDLHPREPRLYQALARLSFQLDRTEAGLKYSKQALELDPTDYQTAYRYARELRFLGRRTESIAVLRQTLEIPAVKEKPEILLELYQQLALLYTLEKKSDQAEDFWEKAITLLETPAGDLAQVLDRQAMQDQLAEAYDRYGSVLVQNGKRARAIDAFRKVEQIDPTRKGSLALRIAQLQAREGHLQDALTSVDTYLASHPQDREGHSFKVQVLRRLGRFREALVDLRRACSRYPANIPLHLLLAEEYHKAGRREEAIAECEGIVARQPCREAYQIELAVFEEQGRGGADMALRLVKTKVREAEGTEDNPGDPRKASHVAALAQALERHPQLAKQVIERALSPLYWGKSLTYSTRQFLGELAARTNQLDQAEQLYRKCLGARGVPARVENEVYSGLLDVLSRAHKHHEVLAVCKHGLERANVTNRVLFHLEKTQAYLALGQIEQALEASTEAVKDAGGREQLLCRLRHAQVLSYANRHDQAIQECLSLFSEYNQADEVRRIRLALSSVYLDAGDSRKSEQQLHLLLDQDPEDATACNNLGYQWAVRNTNLKEAEALIRKALQLDRKERGVPPEAPSNLSNAAFLDSLGWVLFKQGRLKEAQEELQKAVALPEGYQDPVLWDHLGDVQYRLGDKQQACQAWEHALGLYAKGVRPPLDQRRNDIKQKLALHRPE
jgi:tetratricopeptide (TPR) repeat protein